MKIYNTLTRQLEEILPLDNNTIRIYSCGPTVYDYIHIGNLSSFITTDILRRAVESADYETEHVMNITDIDDKTIKKSRHEFPNESPMNGLSKLTEKYSQIFLEDMKATGNDMEKFIFPRATAHIEQMQVIIRELVSNGFAYITEDGIYFSIEAYKKQGKKYGQLLKLDQNNTSEARIDNDEYDKNSIHDFVLWKTQKDDDPAWDFEIDSKNVKGRPGWHIECSAMSKSVLGQPFDIHTGGIDLIFPHHENEIAQSTATFDSEIYASKFVHNEHILVDGNKMSKSLNNFYTLEDVVFKGFSALAFRLLILQSHYRSQTNFSWNNLAAAQNRLIGYQAMADLRFQTVKREHDSVKQEYALFKEASISIKQQLQNDLNTPQVVEKLSSIEAMLAETLVSEPSKDHFENFLIELDEMLGLQFMNSKDITNEQKTLIAERENARASQNWKQADKLRKIISEQNITIRDTQFGPIWYRNKLIY